MPSFTRLDQSKAEDWRHIQQCHIAHFRTTAPLRIMDHIRSLGDLGLGFPCDQLHHSLMTATLARRAGADDETVVVALCHDLGKVMSIPNHAAIGAELLRPYVSEHHYQAVLHHQEFQSRYYNRYCGQPTDLRDAYRGESWYPLAETLVEQWDMPAFDPAFAVDPLESFEPAVIRIFSEPRHM